MNKAAIRGLDMDTPYYMRMPKIYKTFLKREAKVLGRSMNYLLNDALRNTFPELKSHDKIK